MADTCKQGEGTITPPHWPRKADCHLSPRQTLPRDAPSFGALWMMQVGEGAGGERQEEEEVADLSQLLLCSPVPGLARLAGWRWAFVTHDP